MSISCCSGQQLLLENEYPQDHSCNIHLRGGGGGGRKRRGRKYGEKGILLLWQVDKPVVVEVSYLQILLQVGSISLPL